MFYLGDVHRKYRSLLRKIAKRSFASHAKETLKEGALKTQHYSMVQESVGANTGLVIYDFSFMALVI
jgi:hypothetical protein